MEKYKELISNAKKKIHVADYMLTMTYPFVKDPKLLLVILENIFLAIANAIGSVLYYEKTFKRIPAFKDSFASKFNIFKEKIAVRYKIKQEYTDMIQEVGEIILEHKKSPVEFTRKNSFVICSDDYKMWTISTDKIRSYINKSKSFVNIIDNIIKKNQEILKKSIKNF